MSELIILYKWTILAGAMVAAALAILGCHLAARDKAMQTLCLGQGATLGVLLGMAAIHWLGMEEARVHYSPLLSGIALSAGAFLLTEWISHRTTASKNSYYSAFFVFLLATCSLVAATFPALETHMAQVFFGDLATLTNADSIVALGAGVVSLILMTWFWKPIANQSFEYAILAQKRQHWAFSLFTLGLLCLSVQLLGFLFTTACLFLPTTLLRLRPHRGLIPHIRDASLIAGLSCLGGFVISLALPKLPTVPAIVATMTVAAFGVAMGETVFKSAFRSRP